MKGEDLAPGCPDLFASSYELVLGEAKSFVEYGADTVSRMLSLADRFRPRPYLAFATLKDLFTDAEKVLLRDACGKGYRIIPLTRLELDPYHLYERFKDTRSRYTTNFRDLSEACVQLNLQ